MQHAHQFNSGVLQEVENLFLTLTEGSSRQTCRFSECKKLHDETMPLKDSMPEPQFSESMRQIHQGVFEAFMILDSWRKLSDTNSITEVVREKFIAAIRSGAHLPSKGKGGGMAECSRDTAFELQVAAEISAQTNETVRFGDVGEGKGKSVDLYFGNQGRGVECKRPRTLSSVKKKVKEAARQIRDDPKCMVGSVAIDTSFLQNPHDDYVPFDDENPLGSDAKFAGFMSDSMSIEIAKSLCGLDARYFKRLDKIVVYCWIRAVFGEALGAQAASTVIFCNPRGRLSVGVENTLMVSGKLPKRVRVFQRR